MSWRSFLGFRRDGQLVGPLGPVPPRPEGWRCENEHCPADPIYCEYYCGQPDSVTRLYPEVPTLAAETVCSTTISGKTAP